MGARDTMSSLACRCDVPRGQEPLTYAGLATAGSL